MITLGIDLSSQPNGTAACRIHWQDDGEVLVDPPELRCDDPRLDRLIQTAQGIGIDAPLGWPQAFVEAVNQWNHGDWEISLRDRLRFRETDRQVAAYFKKERRRIIPLSVSTDLIALPAMRAMALLKRHGVTDKSGDDRFYEVYPAGSLAVWGLEYQGYKGKSEAAQACRRRIFQNLQQGLPQVVIPAAYVETDHALDALVASLTVRLARTGRSLGPNDFQLASARCEGWIHLPSSNQF